MKESDSDATAAANQYVSVPLRGSGDESEKINRPSSDLGFLKVSVPLRGSGDERQRVLLAG